jgi:chemotaxis protein CheD
MRTEKLEHHRRVILDPGEFYASNVPVTISTLLGSCVSACLFDPVNRVIGMNHFMLSHHRYAKKLSLPTTEAGRYGINAMELLINAMLKLGAEKRLFQAKVFGGSTIVGDDSDADNFFCVGAVNSKFIREFLACEEIPLIAENLGGKEGRVIHFSYGDFAVYMRKIISADRSRRIAIRDRECWLHAITEQEKQDKEMSNVELWG